MEFVTKKWSICTLHFLYSEIPTRKRSPPLFYTPRDSLCPHSNRPRERVTLGVGLRLYHLNTQQLLSQLLLSLLLRSLRYREESELFSR